jgi:hypothetical protein
LKVKSNVFIQLNKEYLTELLKDEWEFTNFLRQAEQLFDIAVYSVFYISALPQKSLTPSKRSALNQFSLEMDTCLDLARHSLGELHYSTSSDTKEKQLISVMYFVSTLYFLVVSFLRDYYAINPQGARAKK